MTPLNDDLLRATRRFDASGRPATRDEANRLAFVAQQKPAKPQLETILRPAFCAAFLRALWHGRSVAHR